MVKRKHVKKKRKNYQFKPKKLKKLEKAKVICPYCNKPIKLFDAMAETKIGEIGFRIVHIQCKSKEMKKEVKKDGKDKTRG